MKTQQLYLKQQRGAALFMALIFLLIMTMLGVFVGLSGCKCAGGDLYR